MTQIGDLVSKAGIYTQPGVIVEKKQDGSVTVDTDPMSVNKFHRYANTTGLSEQEKQVFNTILDEIYQKNDDLEKINSIQTEIDRLKADPGSQNIVQYLRNQQSYLVRQARTLPRVYNLDETLLGK